MTLYIGVDGGASKTDVVLAQDGKLLNIVHGGPSNPQGPLGLEGAMDQLAQSLSLVIQGYDPKDVKGAVLGLAGADFPEDIAAMSEQLTHLLPWLSYTIVNDTEIALLGGSRQGYGIAVICGTSTNVLGIHPNGKRCQIGGLGYEMGDFGGGADLAREVLHVAFRSHEGRGPKTILEDDVLRKLGQNSYEDLKRAMYFHTIHPFAFLALVPACFEAANQNDNVAITLLQNMAQSLAQTVIAAANQLSWHNDPFEVILVGSLWEGVSPVLQSHFRELVQAQFPLSDIHLPLLPPVLGALLQAAQLGGELVDEWRSKLIPQAQHI
ncbi:MAG: hypothetical protein C7B47_03405 [Sulfobacillus thermosulfidooxidans]|uniref:ATPase BadF/BadG/BcrA/BcrD type domain-containing protein n=1 Tax=Sulfobacillus thermosulfidooxidans TaxID=28034 RepID=A0A2T2X3D2_SULTH|nr:MAG: hypothetical protein C7B47_03405 [Sulfobacillus thermosulfidooxidans]